MKPNPATMKTTKSLLTPGLCLLALAMLLHTGLLAPTPALLAYALYGACVAGLLLARRFHSSRIFFALLVLFLSQRAVDYFSSGSASTQATALAAVALLLPLNFVLISLHTEKGFTFPNVAPASLALFLESVVVAVLCRPGPLAASPRAHHVVPTMPLATEVAFAIAAAILLTRYLLYRKPAESGLFWSLVASFLALRFGGVGRIPEAYFAAGALLLAAAVVETSYLLAYQDELTSLPSRRAFHESLLRLQSPYCIAMVDIDHFKSCNDTYGHDTGDEVLRMVAGRLARVTGGGQAYRCGGEEFAVVFSGKTTSEVMEHLETLRLRIESSSFRLRGQDRRQATRGPDSQESGRRGMDRRKASEKPGGRRRPPLRDPFSTHLSVTASMGVAGSGLKNRTAEQVIGAADKALYRAKAGGRNRIESDAVKPRKARSKKAGVA